MPRPKTVQPPPEDEFTLEDGTKVEIRNPSCNLIGRGLHKRDQFDEKRDEILELVVDDYFKWDAANTIWRFSPPRQDYLSTATRFAQKFALAGYVGEEGDDSALRKRIYPQILMHINALKGGLEKYRLT